MARNIQLNSSDWCDIVFTGKNKAYGAYALRQSSSKRHILAFLVVLIFVGVVAGLPSLLKAVTPPKEYVQNVTDIYTIGQLDEPEQEEQIVEPSTTPPPPPVIDSKKFTPPAITPDEMVDPSRELSSQEELNSSRVIISIADVDNGNTEGVDIAEIRREQRQIINQPPQERNQVQDHVEVMPQFPGGNSDLMRYLGANIKYPTIAAENDIEGRVVLKFVVGKDGNISDIQVIRSLDPSCDREAIRVVKSMPKWIPGMQNGYPVAVYFTLPVLFKLQR